MKDEDNSESLGATCGGWESQVLKLKGIDMLYKGLFYTAKAVPGLPHLEINMFVLKEEKRTRCA